MVNVGSYKIDGDNVIKKLRHHFHFDNYHFSGQQDKPCCGGEKGTNLGESCIIIISSRSKVYWFVTLLIRMWVNCYAPNLLIPMCHWHQIILISKMWSEWAPYENFGCRRVLYLQCPPLLQSHVLNNTCINGIEILEL